MTTKQSSSRKGRRNKVKIGVDARTSRSTSGRVVVRSIKTGQFTRSEVRNAIDKVLSERSA